MGIPVKYAPEQTDTLTVSNPGFSNPPTICGYNTGQHMWVPAADSCNQINIGKLENLQRNSFRSSFSLSPNITRYKKRLRPSLT